LRHFAVRSMLGDGQVRASPLFYGLSNNFALQTANNSHEHELKWWLKSLTGLKYSVRYSSSESSDSYSEAAWNRRYNGKLSSHSCTYSFSCCMQFAHVRFVVAFQSKLSELIRYKQEHGNTLVPFKCNKNTQLGHWVNTQRAWYKANKLNPERIKKLDAIEFVWGVLEAQWLERYEELLKYKEEHGDVLVPILYEQNPALGLWVMGQRRDYRHFMAKKRLEENEALQHEMNEKEVKKIKKAWTGMTEERIRLLESEGFVWNYQDYAWQTKFAALCEWIETNGHCTIGRQNKTHDSLRRWVDHQKEMYRRYLKGEKIGLPVETVEERMHKLKHVGLV
jgi:hypothetical protein